MISVDKGYLIQVSRIKWMLPKMISVDEGYLIQVSRIKWIEWILFDLGYPVQMVKNEVNGGGRV